VSDCFEPGISLQFEHYIFLYSTALVRVLLFVEMLEVFSVVVDFDSVLGGVLFGLLFEFFDLLQLELHFLLLELAQSLLVMQLGQILG